MHSPNPFQDTKGKAKAYTVQTYGTTNKWTRVNSKSTRQFTMNVRWVSVLALVVVQHKNKTKTPRTVCKGPAIKIAQG